MSRRRIERDPIPNEIVSVDRFKLPDGELIELNTTVDVNPNLEGNMVLIQIIKGLASQIKDLKNKEACVYAYDKEDEQ